ncbi:glycosyltransferase family 4 protein [Dyella lipolytica]|uniref:Glycosyltransferase family 4 protein n=1 Tax=Dyella lipolytica TaxID=1867835 RepID=A0ABW8IS82_9GAMM
MRVLLLSTSYPRDTSDWRGVFMRHLVGALGRAGELKLSVWAPPGELPAAAIPIMTPHENAWLHQLMEAGGVSHLMRSRGKHAISAPLKLILMIRAVYRRHVDTDIYHINWLQCALPLPSNNKPALITVLGNDLKLLRLPFMKSLLRRVAKKHKAAICPNAEWMHAPLHAAFGDVAKVIPVSFGIDPCWYAIQRHLSLEKPKHWLAVTRLTADKLGPLFDWSRDLFSESGRELHLFGPMQEMIAVPPWVHYHGAVSPEQLATKWFPSAQGLITLSRHAEGRPQVMLEAMAAGLPIIASHMPAHATIVDDGNTGILCESYEDFQLALKTLEDNTTNVRFGSAARAWVSREMGTWDDCAQRYIRIYRSLLRNDTSE